jgi:predicted O-methyltransferase YrrM
MTTLTSPPLSTMIPRLFALAAQADQPVRARLLALSLEERDALFKHADIDYRGFYSEAKDLYLPVSKETATLLYMLIRASGAKNVIEFGTSFGISTLHLAAALRDNGGGRVIGTELEPAKAERARAHLFEAGLADLVEIREGDALESLARDLPQVIDLVLLDGAKVLYGRILELLEPRLRQGALIVADNADRAPDYLARVRGSAEYLSIPLTPDVELSQRV